MARKAAKSQTSRVAIALFRGINVGGRSVRMSELCAFFEALGYQGAQSLIQSGNIVFRLAEAPAAAERKIVRGFAAEWGFEASVMVRTLDELRQALAANPLKRAEKDPAHLLLCFLEGAPVAENVAAVSALAGKGEAAVAHGRTLYLYCPHGIGHSKLWLGAERKIKLAMTARNWTTIAKLIAMGEALEKSQE